MAFNEFILVAKEFTRNMIRLVLLTAGLIFAFSACGNGSSDGKMSADNHQIVEDTMVFYPGRTINYKEKFSDLQSKQEQAARAIGLSTPPQNRQEAAKMHSQLTLVKTNDYFVVDSLTIPSPISYPKPQPNWRASAESLPTSWSATVCPTTAST